MTTCCRLILTILCEYWPRITTTTHVPMARRYALMKRRDTNGSSGERRRDQQKCDARETKPRKKQYLFLYERIIVVIIFIIKIKKQLSMYKTWVLLLLFITNEYFRFFLSFKFAAFVSGHSCRPSSRFLAMRSWPFGRQQNRNMSAEFINTVFAVI